MRQDVCPLPFVVVILTLAGSAAAQPGPVRVWGPSTEIHGSGRQIDTSQRPGGYFSQIAIGLDVTAGLRSDGTIARWGNETGYSSVPPGSYKAIAAGEWHHLLLHTDGSLSMWTLPAPGAASYGSGPNVPDGLSEVIIITAGEYHNVVINKFGKLAAWGGPNTHTATTDVANLNDMYTFTAVSGGDEYTVALTTGGELRAWGFRQEYGQVDAPPVGIAGYFKAISAGQYHAVAITSDGHLIGWGQDYLGSAGGYVHEPGNPSRWGLFNNPSHPSHPPYKEVSCGYLSTIAIRDDANSTIDVWGETSIISGAPHDHNTHSLAQGQSWKYGGLILPANVCYANCDGSTTPPILNASDFACFQQQFAAGDSRADCDGDTAFTILDFDCFQAYFTGGCP